MESKHYSSILYKGDLLKIKNIIGIVLLLFTIRNGLCQNITDTIFYNANWEIVQKSNKASYYRIVQHVQGDDSIGHPFTDYYITGEMQGKGRILSLGEVSDKTTVFNGHIVSFYKDGKIYFEATYLNGEYNGEYIEYAKDGHIVKKMNYKNGLIDGQVLFELRDGTKFLSEVSDGHPVKPYYIIQSKRGKEYSVDYNGNSINLYMPEISGRKMFYRNGVGWQYYKINGVTYAISLSEIKEYGKWFLAQIAITNDSPNTIEFDATDVYANIIKKGFWTETLDTIQQKALEANEYLNKVKEKQNWQTVLLSLAEGFASASSGYSTTHTNTYTYGTNGTYYSQSMSTTYNPAAANHARQASAQRIADFESAQWEQRKAISEGYLRKNTIFPGEVLKGFVLIERPSNYEIIYIMVSLGDIFLNYGWRGSSQ
ncbi:MAG: hypothetical protein IKQ46_08225 [Bacteroidales bacterium]|nr:hypothetical protein [Bacteroidales bacterium]